MSGNISIKEFCLKGRFYMKDEYKELREDVTDDEKALDETLDE